MWRVSCQTPLVCTGIEMDVISIRAMTDELQKMAEEQARPSVGRRLLQAAKVVGVGLAGYGAGLSAGYGAMKGINYLAGRANKPIPPELMAAIARKAGDIGGIGMMLWQSRQAEEIERAVKGDLPSAKR